MKNDKMLYNISANNLTELTSEFLKAVVATGKINVQLTDSKKSTYGKWEVPGMNSDGRSSIVFSGSDAIDLKIPNVGFPRDVKVTVIWSDLRKSIGDVEKARAAELATLRQQEANIRARLARLGVRDETPNSAEVDEENAAGE